MVLNLLVAAGEACATELHNLFTFLDILHRWLTMLCHKNISEELETNSNVVLSNFIVCIFHVLSRGIPYDADIDQFPVIIEDVLCLSWL